MAVTLLPKCHLFNRSVELQPWPTAVQGTGRRQWEGLNAGTEAGPPSSPRISPPSPRTGRQIPGLGVPERGTLRPRGGRGGGAARGGSRGGCEGRGGCTSEKQPGRLSSPQPNPLPAASQLAPPAAHAARGLSGGRQPPRGRWRQGGAAAPGTAEWNPRGGGVENGRGRGARDPRD